MNRHTRTALAAALFISAGLVVMRLAASSAQPRELKLVITDMTFHVEGQEGRNPDLTFKAGEEVKLTLVNADAGMRHNFRIPSWDVGTTLVRGKGEITATFTVPDTKQETQYVCTPHKSKMYGRVIVE